MAKVYISGPISGHPIFETIEKFGRASDAIYDRGDTPVNPAAMSPWNLPWKTYILIANVILSSGDIDKIYMLRGWRESDGAQLEYFYAKLNGIPVEYEEVTV